MDDGYAGDFNLLYDGSDDEHRRTFTATNLITGLPYRFKVAAVNLNAISLDSPVVEIYACQKPSSTNAPERISTTSSSITIRWSEPKANGCPLTSFSIMRNTASGDAISVSVDQASV